MAEPADSSSSSLSSSGSETDHAARMARLEAELARQIRRHNYLAAVASERAAETGAVRDQLAAMQGDRDRLQLQIDSLHRSTSWRITQPLRNVMQWLRKGA